MYDRVDGASCALFRMGFGMVLLYQVWHYLSTGLVDGLYIQPAYHFHYWVFPWITPWEGSGMYWHFYVMGAAALGVMIGAFYRLSATLLFLSFTSMFLMEQARYLNHFYLIALISFLLIFIPTHREWSVDAWRKRSDGRVPYWAVWLLRFQVGVPYFFGGIAKLNPDWLRAEPLRQWLLPITQAEWVPWFLSYSGLGFDLLIVPMLLYKRTRLLGFAMALTFHFANHHLFNIGVFPWLMMAATLIYFPPDWPRQIFEGTGLQSARGRSHWGRYAIGIWVVLQCVIPLRHYLYPSNASWSEEGHKWAWHMKLRSKRADLVYRIKDKDSGEEWLVHPEDMLEHWQYVRMNRIPEMILQFAHHLRDLYGNVEVRAVSRVRLNDHPERLMIDPEVDLAEVEDGILPQSWILPF